MNQPEADRIRTNGRVSNLIRKLHISKKDAELLHDYFKQIPEENIDLLTPQEYFIYRLWRGATVKTALDLTRIISGYDLVMSVSGDYSIATREAIETVSKSFAEVQAEPTIDNNVALITGNKRR